MAYPNTHLATQLYQRAAVTVPPLQAVIMLIDGAILSLRRSMLAVEQRRFEDGHAHLMRSVTILRGLSHHLDLSRGSAVGERLFSAYHALIMASLTSYGRPDAQSRYDRIIAGLTELRDAWRAVAAGTDRTPPRR
ncbi:flagellar protein FliS [Rhodopseudomonas thermotolerans]|uniref:Flagellar protein FliS n=2 Tax=Rhodopseudomonas TaxID=1073 RepID=A0A336JYE1_9BRAD|nr:MULTISPECIES: flagellar export chaperone FliS [Rhodopseudomonas]RED28088.1 flagellar protein FliS [Rhodopseudomonas pentothenatexigens]REF91342.1 flagellar protein FliS [Rhodopseudomonas thermotolerans]SSW92674.1 flagellar protein FliS [Rhodopseudomonas pentothenatexigens]